MVQGDNVLRRRRVMIVGGGFAGLETAKGLRGSDAEVVLLDRKNHHVFQPLLYQVATASLSPASISAPIRSALGERSDCQVVLSNVTGIDVEGK
ncbi:MAG: FAD-dependent oxidoreductase, partial [Myxococcota bacterium]